MPGHRPGKTSPLFVLDPPLRPVSRRTKSDHTVSVGTHPTWLPWIRFHRIDYSRSAGGGFEGGTDVRRRWEAPARFLCNASSAPTRVDTSPLSSHEEEGHLSTSMRHPFTALDVFRPPQGPTSAATRSTRILSYTSVRAPRTCLLFRLLVHPQPCTDKCVVFYARMTHTCGSRSHARSVSNLPFERKRLKGRKETVKGKGAGSMLNNIYDDVNL